MMFSLVSSKFLPMRNITLYSVCSKSALLPLIDLKAKIFDVTMKVVTMDVILSQSNRIFDYVQVDWMLRRPKVTRYLLGPTFFLVGK